MTEAPEYTPFDMTCARCEHDPICFIPLKVTHKLTRKFLQYLKEQEIIKRPSLCRQGRKRRYSVQTHFQENPPPLVSIAEAVEIARRKNHPEVPV